MTPECELLEALFDGSTGTCYLGALSTGTHAGRPALLRPLPEPEFAKVSAVLPILQVLSRPTSTKILGLASSGGTRFIASEYIEGISLLELEATARARGERLPTTVVTRVIRDALLAVHSTQSMLADTGGFVIVSTLSAESIWVAAYGEVYLTELGIIAGVLAAAPPRPGVPARGLEPSPVRAAGAELSRMLARERSSLAALGDKQQLPGAISRLIEMALSARPGHRFSGPATMAEALLSLPPELVADNHEIADAVAQLVGAKVLNRTALVTPRPGKSPRHEPVGDCTRQHDVRATQGELEAALERGLERSKRAGRARASAPSSSARARGSSDGKLLDYDGTEDLETRHYDVVDGEVPIVAGAFDHDLAEEEVTRHFDSKLMLAALGRDTVPPARALAAPELIEAAESDETSPPARALAAPELIEAPEPDIRRSEPRLVGAQRPEREVPAREQGVLRPNRLSGGWAALVLVLLAVGLLAIVGSAWL